MKCLYNMQLSINLTIKNKSHWYSSTTFVENTDPYPFCKFRRNFVSKASFHKSDKQTCNWSLGILKSLLSLSRNQYYLLNNLFDGRQILLLLQYLTRKDFRHLKANPSLFGARVILIDPMIQIATSNVTWNTGDMSSIAGFCGNPTGFLITSNLNVFCPFPTF